MAGEVFTHDKQDRPLGLRKVHFHSADVNCVPGKASSLQILLFDYLRNTAFEFRQTFPEKIFSHLSFTQVHALFFLIFSSFSSPTTLLVLSHTVFGMSHFSLYSPVIFFFSTEFCFQVIFIHI